MHIAVLCYFVLQTFAYAENEHWRSYLEQKAHYLGHFGEMLRRKNEQYYSKREEYANWLVNYREMERENQHHHLESQDEQQELSHEHAEVEHETRHEHRHHGGGLLKRSRLISDPSFIIKSPKEALKFFKQRRKI